MVFMLALCNPRVLREGALRLYRSWAAQVGHACAVTWAPECADLGGAAAHRPHAEVPAEVAAEDRVPLGEAPEHWDWSVPHTWYDASC